MVRGYSSSWVEFARIFIATLPACVALDVKEGTGDCAVVLLAFFSFLKLNIATGELGAFVISEVDGSKIAHVCIIKVRSEVGSSLAISLVHTDVVGHRGGVASAVPAFKAVNAEMIALVANIVSLHTHLEAIDIVIGSFLVEVKKHARLGPVKIVFGEVAVGVLSLNFLLVATLGGITSQDFVGGEASYEGNNELHVFVSFFCYLFLYYKKDIFTAFYTLNFIQNS